MFIIIFFDEVFFRVTLFMLCIICSLVWTLLTLFCRELCVFQSMVLKKSSVSSKIFRDFFHPWPKARSKKSNRPEGSPGALNFKWGYIFATMLLFNIWNTTKCFISEHMTSCSLFVQNDSMPQLTQQLCQNFKRCRRNAAYFWPTAPLQRWRWQKRGKRDPASKLSAHNLNQCQQCRATWTRARPSQSTGRSWI